jgi:hypothetical protein
MLMRLYHLKPCMSRSQTAWSRRVSLAERSRSSFTLFVSLLCAALSLPVMLLTTVSWKSRICVLDSVLEPVVGVELSKKVFSSRAR